jgi:carboxypeptidase family protein
MIPALALFLFFAQNTPQPASVEGIVVKLGSSEPLAGAKVELHAERSERLGPDRTPESLVSTAVTSTDGKFSLASVVPGTYRLTATHTNYVPAEYGQRSPTSQGIPITLSAGQKLTGIQLAMASAGSISGRIYDKDGEPVGRAQVQALRSIYKDGARVLTIVQSVETNDRGEYRIFWLAPGTYYVSAKPDIPQLPDLMLGPVGVTMSAVRVTDPARFGSYSQGSSAVVKKRVTKTGEVIEEVSIPVYYPGVLDAQTATPIPLAAGTNMTGVDISIAPGIVPALHIRGRLIDGTTGQPIPRMGVMAMPRSRDPLIVIPDGQTDPNGNFDIAGVAPGAYFLVATTAKVSVITAVEVGNSGLQNIPIVAMPPVKLTGRFIIEGNSRTGAELRMQDLRVDRLTRVPDLLGIPLGGPSYNPPAQSDGSFTLDGVSPGDFRVSVRTGSQDAYVKSIRMGNADVLDAGLHITGPPDALLEVVIGVSGGRVSGKLVNARGESLSNRTVVLVPDARLRHRTDLYKSVATDAAGAFRFQGIPPGDYELFAWENVESGAWQDPNFIRPYEGRGKKVLINENADENLELTVIP